MGVIGTPSIANGLGWRWIWLGGLMMGFGGLLAAFDKRYRVKVKTRVRDALGLNGVTA